MADQFFFVIRDTENPEVYPPSKSPSPSPPPISPLPTRMQALLAVASAAQEDGNDDVLGDGFNDKAFLKFADTMLTQ